MPKPKISEPKCAESAKIAIEPARYPPYNSSAIKTIETQVAQISFFFAAVCCFLFFKISAAKEVASLTLSAYSCIAKDASLMFA